MTRLSARLSVPLFFAIAVGATAQVTVPAPPTPTTNAVGPVPNTGASSTNAVAASTNAAAASTPPAVMIDPFSDPLIKQVESRHEKAAKGDIKETKSLTADLEKWTKDQPNNHLLQAYLGSVYTLDSRDAWPGPGKLAYLRNGGRLLDAAVAAAPDNPAVRFVRAIDYFELPAIFGKRQTARDDFVILLRMVEGQEKTPFLLSVETQQAIYYFAGQSLRRSDARPVWGKGVGP